MPEDNRSNAFIAFQRNKAQEASGVTPSPDAPTPTDAPVVADPAPDAPKPASEPTPDPVVPATDTSNPDPAKPTADPSTEPKPVAGEEPAKADATAKGEEPDAEKGEDNTELDDDTLAALAKMYPDKLLASEALKATVDKRVQDEVETQLRTTSSQNENATRVQELIDQGKAAATRMGQQATKANELIAQAKQIENSGLETDGVSFDADEFKADLTNYGAAVVAELTQRYDNAFTSGVQQVLNRMPELTADQQGEIGKIVEQAKRMEGDPEQAALSKQFFTGAVLEFLFDAALDVGATQERTRLTEIGQNRKTISDSAAVKAAAARIVKSRGNPPPETPGGTKPAVGGAPSGEYSSDYYRGLKKEGKHAEAAAYVDTFGRGKVALTSGV